MREKKTISTVIPTFNRKLFLEKAIKSSLTQTINHEIIVCNHGGSDGTDEMIKQYEGKIKYIKKTTDNGPHYCWLDGVMEANGEYINLLFDDDWLESNYLEECMKYFHDPQVGFVFTPAKIYDDKNKTSRKVYSYDYLSKDGIYNIKRYETNLLYKLISPTSFIMRKEDMLDALYCGKLPFAKNSYKGVGPDRFMILLCLLRYQKFAFVNKPLVYFREHLNSITIDSSKDKIKKEMIKKAYDEVDEYYYTIKYGKFFSFFHNIYIFRFRYFIKNPRLSLKKIISKIVNNL
jgi:glycosyltransferase involved in cell wall biosynthesis